ncbi:MAG: hypothetical protein FJX45_02030 [Alphaproteobacteria bacterium]|nr:hypothetical protein [Alphaproteobacteria bacterium]MBM3651676.1 hypothetical protein [Alphaproteobacteria bacterium]
MIPKPIEFTLTTDEAANLLEPSGEGGHQNLHARLIEQLQNGNLAVKFDDADIGELFRYMTYGWDSKGGGFQSRLKKAFLRSFRERLKL